MAILLLIIITIIIKMIRIKIRHFIYIGAFWTLAHAKKTTRHTVKTPINKQ